MSRDYRDTLNLPKTDFPMKADLVRREPERLAQWNEMNLYHRLMERRREGAAYILHDGPPYANGRIHIGHALNKLLKDFVVRSRSMEGNRAPYIPGWDCHGLPIEHQVLKELGPKKNELSKIEIRKLCREYAERFIAIQRDEFTRLGVIGDWKNPYLTMSYSYEADIVRELGKVVESGAVYRAKKPVLWCPVDETALAEAEVEYEDHTSPSIYVKFPVSYTGGKFKPAANGTSVVIWTTTPWTLVANKAISVHPAFRYRFVETPHGELIVAEELLDACMGTIGLTPNQYRVRERAWMGSDLEGIRCRHPWLPIEVPVIVGDHVTRDQGTGCVHTAPGHGQEDFEIGQRYGLEVYAPVDAGGRFTKEAGPFSGQKVFEANRDIVALLAKNQTLLREETIRHSYPHCWRCKQPVIFRATEQWFVSMEKTGLREAALAEIDRNVAWIPKWGRDRIFGMIENRPDWCISRQRVWGVPIVAFACEDCGVVAISPEIIRHVADLIERDGTDIWFDRTAEALLPAGSRCAACHGSRFRKLEDILDVWFESGVSHAAVLKTRPDLKWPADLYLEGSDQHRGWFHSSLLAGLLTDGRAPYRAVLTHGFVVDGAGKKMSKSAGNVVAPQEVIAKHGAEILRLWVAATDFREDVRISPEILAQLVEAYRKIRNTCRFMLGNLYDFRPGASNPEAGQEELDRFILHRYDALVRKVIQAYRDFEFHIVFHALNNFCAVDLSAIYLDILKDRLYTTRPEDPRRRAAQAILFEIVGGLARLMAPILVFTAEEIEAALPGGAGDESIHLQSFPKISSRPEESGISDRWARLLTVRAEVARALETKRNEKTIGASQDADVTISADAGLHELLARYIEFLPDLFIVSRVHLKPWASDAPGLTSDVLDHFRVQVDRAGGAKCGRCWRFRDAVGRNPDYPDLCDRCAGAVAK